MLDGGVRTLMAGGRNPRMPFHRGSGRASAKAPMHAPRGRVRIDRALQPRPPVPSPGPKTLKDCDGTARAEHASFARARFQNRQGCAVHTPGTDQASAWERRRPGGTSARGTSSGSWACPVGGFPSAMRSAFFPRSDDGHGGNPRRRKGLERDFGMILTCGRRERSAS